MKSEGKSRVALSKPQIIEWRVCEDERDWRMTKADCFESPSPVMRPRQWTLQWGVPSLLITLVLALLGGWWLWVNAQAGLGEIETELQAAVTTELWSASQATSTRVASPNRSTSPVAWHEQSLLNASPLPTGAGVGEVINEAVKAVEIRDLGKDWAVIQVLVQLAATGPAYRQTRVYHYSDLGWVRAEVTAARWGKARQLESTYFVFHYYGLDDEAVTQAAIRLDALYPTLYGSFFSGQPGSEKQVVLVDPELKPGELPWQTPAQRGLVVASPAATLAPVDLAESDVLVQSVVLILHDKLAEQAAQIHDLPPQWPPLRNGLRLWLIWQQELPLAIWRKPLVKWVFGDSHNATGPKAFAVPTFAHDLCADHKLWMRSPLEVAVPVLCWQPDGGEEKIVAWRYRKPRLELSLPPLMDMPVQTYDISLWQDVRSSEPAVATVAMATVVEYTVSTFGADRLPVLLAALAEHENWETVVPAVFGLTLADFNRGWQVFLAERYEITP